MAMGRPRKTPTDSGPLTIQVSEEMRRGFERWRDHIRQTVVGAENITVQDVMRGALARALAAFEAETRGREREPRPSPPEPPRKQKSAKRAAK